MKFYIHVRVCVCVRLNIASHIVQCQQLLADNSQQSNPPKTSKTPAKSKIQE